MGKSTSDILLKTKKSFEYLRDIGSLNLEKESLKLKRYSLFAKIGRLCYDIHCEKGLEVPELSDLIQKADMLTDAVSLLQDRIDNLKSSSR